MPFFYASRFRAVNWKISRGVFALRDNVTETEPAKFGPPTDANGPHFGLLCCFSLSISGELVCHGTAVLLISLEPTGFKHGVSVCSIFTVQTGIDCSPVIADFQSKPFNRF